MEGKRKVCFTQAPKDSIAQAIPHYLRKPLLQPKTKKKAYLNHHSHEFGQKATKKTIIPGSEISIKNNKTSSKSDAANKPIEKVSTKKKYLKDNIFHQCLAHYKYSCKGIILVFK